MLNEFGSSVETSAYLSFRDFRLLLPYKDVGGNLRGQILIGYIHQE